jgi:hypothetical protein
VCMRCASERVLPLFERLLEDVDQESEAQVDEMRATGSVSSAMPIRRGRFERPCRGFGVMDRVDAASVRALVAVFGSQIECRCSLCVLDALYMPRRVCSFLWSQTSRGVAASLRQLSFALSSRRPTSQISLPISTSLVDMCLPEWVVLNCHFRSGIKA